jgi:hypothetical protein
MESGSYALYSNFSERQLWIGYLLKCGPRRDRTDDLSTASAALSQLSYGPAKHCNVRDARQQSKEMSPELSERRYTKRLPSIYLVEGLNICRSSLGYPCINGLWRRLVARSLGVREVGGSNPLSPTKLPS